MTTTRIKCSLGLENVAPEELHAHREQDTREIDEYTISLIQSHHPGGTQADPACQRCWDYYINLPAN